MLITVLTLTLALHPAQGNIHPCRAERRDRTEINRLLATLEIPEAAPILVIHPAVPEAAPIPVIRDLFPDPRKRVQPSR